MFLVLRTAVALRRSRPVTTGTRSTTNQLSTDGWLELEAELLPCTNCEFGGSTPPYRFLGLVHGSLLNVRDVRRFHCKEIAGGLARGGGNIPIRKLVGNNIAGGASLFGGNVVHQNLRVAQLAKLIIADGLVAKLLGDIVQDLIGFLADRLLHLHLQDQVRAALQVQTKLNAVGKIRFQDGQRLWRIGNSNQTDKTYKNDGCDENCFPLEVRIHGLGWLRTP